jgi:hypothetical protein
MPPPQGSFDVDKGRAHAEAQHLAAALCHAAHRLAGHRGLDAATRDIAAEAAVFEHCHLCPDGARRAAIDVDDGDQGAGQSLATAGLQQGEDR